ncbi:unnamed protein product [Menidia menidia]|uniref:(Atlantic silverside) hypothetical protein n=1 Tax=Menidia menidia TaxID=238744 RepID=A0A8S4BUC6_9TELE|nr:unnamed protein product [Menidia menidia]
MWKQPPATASRGPVLVHQHVHMRASSCARSSSMPDSVIAFMATEFHNLQEMRQSASLVTKVFIQRDYSEGTVCRFQIKFPSELENRIERALLEQTLRTINSFYVEAEKIGGQSYLEGCLACATAYIIFLCMETRYEKVLKKISAYIQEQNEKIYAPRGLLLTDPVERGMRVVSFVHLLLKSETIRHWMRAKVWICYIQMDSLEISVFEDRGSVSSSPSTSVSSGSSAR